MKKILKTYVKVIVPLALDGEFSYEVPLHLMEQVAVGKRVEVQFGRKRIYAAMVRTIYQEVEPTYMVKPILNVLDESPILFEQQIKLWEWIASYYMSSLGEVMYTALPSAYKLSSETKLMLNPTFGNDLSLLNDKEFLIAEALSVQEEITVADMQQILQQKTVTRLLKSLIEKGIVLVKEEIKHRYKAKTKKYIELSATYKESENLQTAFKELARAKKQLALLMSYMQISGVQNTKNPTDEYAHLVEKKELLTKAEASGAQCKALIDKGIFAETQRVISRLDDTYKKPIIDYALSEDQTRALQQIRQHFETKSVVLLHGVTSSGKTQVYIKLMEEVIKQGKQVMYLLPEIALTSQMIARLRKVFGENIGIYHSKFNAQERIEIWQKTLNEEYKVVVGARSALFLPFANLGLIVVDEEHDSSFKQYDPAPRYHARDAAIYLAVISQAKIIIGSATPALESYHNASQLQKYGLVTMNKRYGNVAPPEIVLASIRSAIQKKEMQSHFTKTLLDELKIALNNGEQAIIFQNRRGYAPYLNCMTCGEWIPQCYQCDVSLTYHKYSDSLKCHYCGYNTSNITKCGNCSSTNLSIKGFGTEKIEDELKLFFPDAQFGRLDLETARSKTGFERVIKKFENKEIDILVGTQMVTKGLDFDNVSIVGIVSADHLLNFPDFRAVERAFQLMLQVSGRAGRRKKQGKVIIQTLNMKHPVLQYVINGNYLAFYEHELHERIKFNYPPFVRMILITVKHKIKERLNQGAMVLARYLKEGLGRRVLGPTVPLVSRIRNYHIRHIMIKLEKSSNVLTHYKAFIKQSINNLRADKNYSGMVVQLDIDPCR